jgi:hypothetical protein
MTDDDPCRAQREALAEAALKFSSGPVASLEGTEGQAEPDEKAVAEMAKLEQELVAAQAAFDECEAKNPAAEIEVEEEG